MARRAVRIARPIGAPLPSDFWSPARWTGRVHWRIDLMMAKVSEADYAITANRFAAEQRGRFSDDWHREWKAWCRGELQRRAIPARVPRRGLFD
jgi:hypothetical protein